MKSKKNKLRVELPSKDANRLKRLVKNTEFNWLPISQTKLIKCLAQYDELVDEIVIFSEINLYPLVKNAIYQIEKSSNSNQGSYLHKFEIFSIILFLEKKIGERNEFFHEQFIKSSQTKSGKLHNTLRIHDYFLELLGGSKTILSQNEIIHRELTLPGYKSDYKTMKNRTEYDETFNFLCGQQVRNFPKLTPTKAQQISYEELPFLKYIKDKFRIFQL